MGAASGKVNGTAAVGGGLEVLQSMKNKTAISLSSPPLGVFPKELHLGPQRDSCPCITLPLITALFPVARMWTRAVGPAGYEWTEKMRPMPAAECQSATRDNVDGLREHSGEKRDLMLSVLDLKQRRKHGRLSPRFFKEP